MVQEMQTNFEESITNQQESQNLTKSIPQDKASGVLNSLGSPLESKIADSQGSAAETTAVNQTDFEMKESKRKCDHEAHTDAILDLALIDYKPHETPIPLLVSCSRDSTVKVWRF